MKSEVRSQKSEVEVVKSEVEVEVVKSEVSTSASSVSSHKITESSTQLQNTKLRETPYGNIHSERGQSIRPTNPSLRHSPR